MLRTDRSRKLFENSQSNTTQTETRAKTPRRNFGRSLKPMKCFLMRTRGNSTTSLGKMVQTVDFTVVEDFIISTLMTLTLVIPLVDTGEMETDSNSHLVETVSMISLRRTTRMRMMAFLMEGLALVKHFKMDLGTFLKRGVEMDSMPQDMLNSANQVLQANVGQSQNGLAIQSPPLRSAHDLTKNPETRNQANLWNRLLAKQEDRISYCRGKGLGWLLVHYTAVVCSNSLLNASQAK